MDSVREAIRGGSTRRTVVRTGAWSVPVIAVAIAAPAFAASKTICNICNGALPVNCTVTVVVGDPNGPTCNCADGLVCGKVLNFLNVCVATNLLATNCGGTTCNGVCLASGGTIVNAINTLVGSLDAINVAGCGVKINSFLPNNICVVPATNPTAGTFGSLCIVNNGSGATSAAVDTTIAAVGGSLGGLVFATACASPFSCKAGINGTAQGSCVGQTVDFTIGFCQC